MLSHSLTNQISSLIKRPTTTFNHLGYISERYNVDHNACISLYSSMATNNFKQASAYYLKKPDLANQIVSAWRDKNTSIVYLAYKHRTSPSFIAQLLLSSIFHLDMAKDKAVIQAILQFPPYVYLYYVPNHSNQHSTYSSSYSLPNSHSQQHSQSYTQTTTNTQQFSTNPQQHHNKSNKHPHNHSPSTQDSQPDPGFQSPSQSQDSMHTDSRSIRLAQHPLSSLSPIQNSTNLPFNPANNLALLQRLHEALQIALNFNDPSSLYLSRIKNRVGNDYEVILHYYIKTQLNIGFLTDLQLRGQNQTKTPDILFPIPLCVEQWFIRWFDSKMLFASMEVLDSIQKQIQGYGYRFDLGACIFWSGVELMNYSSDNVLGYTSSSLDINDLRENHAAASFDLTHLDSTTSHRHTDLSPDEDSNDDDAPHFSPDFLSKISFLNPNQHQYLHNTPLRPLAHSNQTCAQLQRLGGMQYLDVGVDDSELGSDGNRANSYQNFCGCAIGHTQRFHHIMDEHLFSTDGTLNDSDAGYELNLSWEDASIPTSTIQSDPFLDSLLQFHLVSAHFFTQQCDSVE